MLLFWKYEEIVSARNGLHRQLLCGFKDVVDVQLLCPRYPNERCLARVWEVECTPCTWATWRVLIYFSEAYPLSNHISCSAHCQSSYSLCRGFARPFVVLRNPAFAWLAALPWCESFLRGCVVELLVLLAIALGVSSFVVVLLSAQRKCGKVGESRDRVTLERGKRWESLCPIW